MKGHTEKALGRSNEDKRRRAEGCRGAGVQLIELQFLVLAPATISGSRGRALQRAPHSVGSLLEGHSLSLSLPSPMHAPPFSQNK